MGKNGGSWSPCFNKPFNDWELEEVERLFCCLDGKKVNVDEEDRVRWMESKDGVFSVKSLYRALQPFLLFLSLRRLYGTLVCSPN